MSNNNVYGVMWLKKYPLANKHYRLLIPGGLVVFILLLAWHIDQFQSPPAESFVERIYQDASFRVNDDPIAALSLINQAIAAINTNNHPMLVKLELLKLIAYTHTQQISRARDSSKKLATLLENHGHGYALRLRINTYLALSQFHQSEPNPVLARETIRQGLALIDNHNTYLAKQLYFTQGLLEQRDNNIPAAIQSFKQVVAGSILRHDDNPKLSEQRADNKQTIDAWLQLSELYLMINEDQLAQQAIGQVFLFLERITAFESLAKAYLTHAQRLTQHQRLSVAQTTINKALVISQHPSIPKKITLKTLLTAAQIALLNDDIETARHHLSAVEQIGQKHETLNDSITKLQVLQLLALKSGQVEAAKQRINEIILTLNTKNLALKEQAYFNGLALAEKIDQITERSEQELAAKINFQNSSYLLASIAVLMVMIFSYWLKRNDQDRFQKELAVLERHLTFLSAQDAETNLLNRRGFAYQVEFEANKRSNSKLEAALCWLHIEANPKIDRNNTADRDTSPYLHMAQLLSNEFKDCLVGRWENNEFLVLKFTEHKHNFIARARLWYQSVIDDQKRQQNSTLVITMGTSSLNADRTLPQAIDQAQQNLV